MAQITFGSNASPSLPNLDLNFADVYDLRELVKSSSYASPSAQKFDATSGSWILTGSGVGLGYGTGSGGAVTQLTNKSTGVTLNKASGQVTMNNAALASNATAIFVVTNSVTVATDVICAIPASGMASGGTYTVSVGNVGAGAFSLAVKNVSGGSLSEALVISFVVIKAVNA